VLPSDGPPPSVVAAGLSGASPQAQSATTLKRCRWKLDFIMFTSRPFAGDVHAELHRIPSPRLPRRQPSPFGHAGHETRPLHPPSFTNVNVYVVVDVVVVVHVVVVVYGQPLTTTTT
jgi:hypothetical protein